MDILLITETWLTGTSKDKLICDELAPPGYNVLHKPRKNRRGGGVAVVCRSSIVCEKMTVSVKTSEFELMELLMKITGQAVRLCVLYKPPSNTSFDSFIQDFITYADAMTTLPGKLLMVGDFNIYVDNQQDAHAQQFMEILTSLNLEQHVSGPTHIRGHTLDLIVTRTSETIITPIKTHAPIMSDHMPLTFGLHILKPPNMKTTITSRNIKNINTEAFTEDINNSELITNPATDIHSLVDQYNTTLASILDSHAPVQTKVIQVRHRPPWITEAILDAKRARRRAERKWKSSRLHVDMDILQVARKLVNKLCKTEKREYYKDKIKKNAGDQRELYRITDQLLCRKKTRALPGYTDPKTIADKLASFFIEKIEKITQSFSSTCNLSDNSSLPPQSLTEHSLTKLSPVARGRCKENRYVW